MKLRSASEFEKHGTNQFDMKSMTISIICTEEYPAGNMIAVGDSAGLDANPTALSEFKIPTLRF